MKKVFSTILMILGVLPLFAMVFSGLIAGLIVNGFKIGYDTMDYNKLKAKMKKED